MNKLKAVFIAVCVVFLYYVIRPISCFLSALLESRLMSFSFFKEVFLLRWEEVGNFDVDIAYVKELWNETS